MCRTSRTREPSTQRWYSNLLLIRNNFSSGTPHISINTCTHIYTYLSIYTYIYIPFFNLFFSSLLLAEVRRLEAMLQGAALAQTRGRRETEELVWVSVRMPQGYQKKICNFISRLRELCTILFMIIFCTIDPAAVESLEMWCYCTYRYMYFAFLVLYLSPTLYSLWFFKKNAFAL